MRAAWLADEVLLVAPASAAEAVDVVEATVSTVFEAPQGTIVAARNPTDLESAGIAPALTDLRTFLREGPAGWDAATRSDLLGFLSGLGIGHGLSASLSDGLRRVREALRERRPVTIEDRRVGRGVAVERVHRIDPHSFYVRGRAWDEVAPIAKLAATSPEGEKVDLLDRVFRHPALGSGFIGLFQIATPSRGADGWVFESAGGAGRAVETPAALAPDPLDTILADAAREFAGADIVELESHGRLPSSPAVSLVVPLQRRIDLIEHQLAQFSADPEFGECELLYVLDDAERSDALEGLSRELFGLYGLPFRIAALTRTAGAPIASGLGAELARAERLVFLDADVLPASAGWLGAMAAALDADRDVGAVTPKLLFADEAIDQAGLDFPIAERSARGRSIQHRLRGMHRDVPAAAEAAEVAAAGMACLMIDAADFREAGGLRSEYGLGAYEGADLSRRLAERGRTLRYVPEAELYRLEGLGASPEPLGESYARWLHSRLWADQIAGVGR